MDGSRYHHCHLQLRTQRYREAVPEVTQPVGGVAHLDPALPHSGAPAQATLLPEALGPLPCPGASLVGTTSSPAAPQEQDLCPVL